MYACGEDPWTEVSCIAKWHYCICSMDLSPTFHLDRETKPCQASLGHFPLSQTPRKSSTPKRLTKRLTKPA